MFDAGSVVAARLTSLGALESEWFTGPSDWHFSAHLALSLESTIEASRLGPLLCFTPGKVKFRGKSKIKLRIFRSHQPLSD